MIKWMGYVLRICLTLFAVNSFASSELFTANNFHQIAAILKQHTQPSNTLIVFDDDDTLTTLSCPNTKHCQYLGSPAWFDWQRSLQADDHQRIGSTFTDLIEADTLIIDSSQMILTDKSEHSVIKNLQADGYHMIVETARKYNLENATEKQLDQNRLLALFQTNTLKPKYSAGAVASPFTVAYFKRRVVYANGIYYVCGQNKALLLNALLPKLKQTDKLNTLVLIDDAQNNIDSFYQIYKSNKKIHGIAIHYTKLNKHQANFLANAKLHQLVTKRWLAIHTALKQNLLGYSTK